MIGSPFPLVDGHSDPALSEAGLAQAGTVAERLAGEELGGIFTSTLRRTRETAAPLAELTGLEPEPLFELREVFLGEFEGGEYRIRAGRGDPVIGRVFANESWAEIPGGEPAEEFAARVRSGVERVVERVGADTTAAVIAHGAVIGEICRQAADSRPFAFVHADNCSISRVVVHGGGRWLLRSFNDVSHLTVRTGPASYDGQPPLPSNRVPVWRKKTIGAAGSRPWGHLGSRQPHSLGSGLSLRWEGGDGPRTSGVRFSPPPAVLGRPRRFQAKIPAKVEGRLRPPRQTSVPAGEAGRGQRDPGRLAAAQFRRVMPAVVRDLTPAVG